MLAVAMVTSAKATASLAEALRAKAEAGSHAHEIRRFWVLKEFS